MMSLKNEGIMLAKYKMHLLVSLLIVFIVNQVSSNFYILNIILLGLVVAIIFFWSDEKKRTQIVSAEFESGIIYSPISGVVSEIVNDSKSNSRKILIKSKPGFLLDICFPISGEITKVGEIKRSRVKSFLKKRNFFFFFKNISNSKSLSLQISSPFKVTSILRRGDRGTTGAILSRTMIFGSLEIYLPPLSIINVQKGDEVFIGNTPIASWN